MKTDYIKEYVRAMLVHFSEGKFAYVVKGLRQVTVDLQSVLGSLEINEDCEDLETTLGHQSLMDLNPGPAQELKKNLEAVQLAVSTVRTKFIKDLLHGTGKLKFTSNDKYEFDVQSPYSGIHAGFETAKERIDDFDYTDDEIVKEALEKYVVAKELFYDKNYKPTEAEVFLNEKAARLDEQLRTPLAAYFIAATRTESTRDILEFVDMLFESKKFKSFIADVNTVLSDNREDDHDDSTMLKELIEDSAFRGRIFTVSTRYKHEHIKETSPQMGKFVESLKEILDLDDNYQKRETPPLDDEDFSDWA